MLRKTVVISAVLFFVSTLPIGCTQPPEQLVPKRGKDIAEMIPIGEFYSQEVLKPWDMLGSGLYSAIKEKPDYVKNILERYYAATEYFGIERRKALALTTFISTDSREKRLDFIFAAVSEGELKRHLEAEWKWDPAEEKRGEYKYIYDKKTEQAVLLLPSGLISSSKRGVEAVVSVAAGEGGGKSLAEDDRYQAALKLVEPSATKYTLVWGQMERVRRAWIEALSTIVPDGRFTAAVEKMEAIGFSSFWADGYEVVQKVVFDSPETAGLVAEGIRINMETILRERRSFFLTDLFEGVDKTKAAERLKDKGKVTSDGNLVEIRFKVTLDDVKELF
jgi:hypothetical protein